MHAEALSDPSGAAATLSTEKHNNVLVLLTMSSAVAMFSLPWLTLAPNRLVSGQPLRLVSLLQAPWPLSAGVVIAAVVTLVGLSLSGPGRRTLWVMLAGVMGLLPVLCWLAGAQASVAAQTASSAARASVGGGFWGLFGLLVLLMAELLQRLRLPPLLRSLSGLTTAALVGGLLYAGACDNLSIMKEFANRSDVFWSALVRHALIVAVSLGLTLVIGLPLGALSHRQRAVRRALMPVLNVLQTIPSIALFGLLMAPLAWLGNAVPLLGQSGLSGVGLAPAVIALTLYGLLPVVRGVLTGLAEVPPGVLQAARSMGLSGGQALRWVAWPLALPVLLAGVRTAAVQLVGLAAVAALIGSGGLGAIMFEGLFSAAQDVVLLAVLPIVGMGILVDGVFSTLARMTRLARVRALATGARHPA